MSNERKFEPNVGCSNLVDKMAGNGTERESNDELGSVVKMSFWVDRDEVAQQQQGYQGEGRDDQKSETV